jgi:hypothetical protein
MAWTPAATLLTTTDENKNLSFSITYETDSTGVPDPVTGEIPPAVPAVVTVTAITPNPNIKVVTNTISGFYTEAFAYNVNYIDLQRNDYTVTHFSDIDLSKIHELYKYTPNMNTSVTFEYLATARDSVTNAVLATQTYSIVVTQNWTTNKNLLKRYVNFEDYIANYVIPLLGSGGVPVSMLNNLGNPVYWERT